MEDSINCPHCGKTLILRRRAVSSSSEYSGSGTTVNPHDKFIAADSAYTAGMRDMYTDLRNE
jgi:hypothetical protein